MAVFPLSHYYFLHLLILALQVLSMEMKHLQTVYHRINFRKHKEKYLNVKDNYAVSFSLGQVHLIIIYYKLYKEGTIKV